MNQTLGQHLDDPKEFFAWLSYVIASVEVLNATARSDFLAHLGDEPSTVEALSEACGIPADKLGRIVYFLAAEEVVTLLPDGRVAHTSRSRRLPSLKAAIVGKVHGLDAGIPLYEALRAGVTSYEYRFGKPVFEYLREHPGLGAMFGEFMAYLTTLGEQFVFTQHTFEPFARVVDVGGSHGGLLLKMLAQHEHAHGVLFDLPDVTARVAATIESSAQGNRVEVVGGDFFEAVPAGDLYLLKMILHDWNDAECIRILRRIREAIAPGGRVAVIEHVMPERPQPHPANAMDIAMLVWAEGRERKLSEFRALFEAAGFTLDRLTENPYGQSVIEAIAK
jgi:hypothetical protein